MGAGGNSGDRHLISELQEIRCLSPEFPPRTRVLHFDFLRSVHVNSLALFSARALEVNQTVNTPNSAYRQGDIRLTPAHAGDHERSDQVEQHTHEIRRNSEQRNEHVFEAAERMVLAESNDGDDT